MWAQSALLATPMQKTIAINTVQNVVIQYEAAPLRERALAWVMDGFIIGIGYSLLTNLLVRMVDVSGENAWLIVIAVGGFLVFFAYFFLFELLRMGQTLGKMALHIRVIRLDGKEATANDILLRTLLQTVDTLFCFGAIGVVLIKTTDKNQRFGDMAANTTVIRLRSNQIRFSLHSILNIASLDNYTPQYPQVKQLSEADMFFIKNLLTRYEQYPNVAHQHVVEDLVTHLMPLLGVEQRPMDRLQFLRTLLSDYIVLTR